MKNILALLFIFLSLQSIGQEITVSEQISVRSGDQYDFLGKIKNQYLVFRQKGFDFEVQSFDKNLKLAWEKEIELEKRRTNLLAIVPSKDDFSVIYSFRKKRNLKLVVSQFSPAANLLDTVIIKDFEKLVLTPSFRIIISENRKTVLIYQVKEQKKIEAIAFSLETMKVLWERTLQPQDMAYYENYEQIVLSNEGDVFVVLKRDNRKMKRETHHYEIHQITANNTYTYFDVSMDGNLTYDVLFSFDNKNNRLMAGGLYSEKNRGRANGYFVLSIPPESPEDHLLVFEKFDEEITEKFIGKKADEKKGVANIDVQEIVHRRDGGMIVIFERNRILERGGTGNRVGYGGRSIVDYYFDDLLVMSIHPDGETHWKKVMHKKQYSQDDEAVFSSYFLLKTPSALRFIFNDEIKFENTVSEYVVKGNGDFDRNSVMSTDDQKIQLRFPEALQVGVNEFIVTSFIRSKIKLIRVKF